MRALLNAATALVFFAFAALFVWGIYMDAAGAVDCSAPGGCALYDYYRILEHAPFSVLMVIFFAGLGARVIWGMRHGDRS